MSRCSDEALAHLKRLKPMDGWSIESKKGADSSQTVRLLRRNVPLTDNFFLDIYVDRDNRGQVVGILAAAKTPNASTTLAQVLVNEKGQPVNTTGSKQLIQVRGWKPSTGPRYSTTTRAGTQGSGGSASDVDSEMTVAAAKYIAMAVTASILVRVLMSAMYGLVLLAVPAAYFYLLQTVPSVESFDAKKELKRVFRGQHLPDEHVDKPKGFLGKAMARVNASVTTELLSMPGYTVEMYTLAGAAHVATVKLPSGNLACYWLGAAGQWRYVFSRELEPTKRE